MIQELVSNASMLVAAVFIIAQLIKRPYISRRASLIPVVSGGSFGLLGILLMIYSVHATGTVLVDLRHLAIIAAALYGGMPAALISGVVIAVGRLVLFGISEKAFIASANAVFMGLLCGWLARLSIGAFARIMAMNAACLAAVFVTFLIVLGNPSLLIQVFTAQLIIATAAGAFVASIAASIERSFKLFERVIESEERYRRLVELSPNAIVVHRAGLILFANEQAYRMLGDSPVPTLVGLSYLSFVAPAFRSKTEERSERVLRTQSPEPPEPQEYISADGNRIEAEVSVTGIMYEGEPAVMSVIRDVGARNEFERKLKEQSNLIERILESHYEGIVMVDGGGKIRFANWRFRSNFGGLQLEGRTIESCWREVSGKIESGSRLGAAVMAFCQGETDGLSERFIVADGGKTTYIQVKGIPLRDAEWPGVMLVFRDRTEEELLDVRKDEFVSTVSHEIRTPLASIQGFAEIMLHREVDAEKQRKYLLTIHKEANRLGSLINDFLDVQRMSSGRQEYHFELVEIIGLVREIVEQWDGRNDHRIVYTPADREAFVQADSNRLKQVLHNLLSNAVKYSPGQNRVDVNVEAYGGRLRIGIRDFGLGIPFEAQDKLFTKFFRVDSSDRRKIGGTGLGLAIVKEIVEAHDGSVSVQSQPGKGSLFTVELIEYAV